MLRPLTAYSHLDEKAEGLLRGMKLWEKKIFLSASYPTERYGWQRSSSV